MTGQRFLKRTLLIFFFLAAAILSAIAQTNIPVPAPASQPARQVLAFYYTWYGPDRHWGKANVAQHDIEASRHYPQMGAYDSHDPRIIAKQIAAARKCGVTGFICTWWGQGTYEDQAVSLTLAAAQGKNFNVTVYWEAAPGEGKAQVDNAVSDLVYLASHYGTNSAFLKVDGKPVIFIYGRVMQQVPYNEWPEIISQAHAKAGDFLLVADGYSEQNAELFDGVHTYNICAQVKNQLDDTSTDKLRTWAAGHYAHAVNIARAHGRISCVDVIPGYDDTKIRHPGLDVERLDGQVYSTLWEEAVKANPDWVLITTWNEWHEGSEIEASYEFGNKYLKLTDHYAPSFLKGTR
jgi:glycoprotein endo-alpha-1,2-mannosidase